MKSKFLIFFFLSFINLFAGTLPSDKATGLFMAIGVGPRLPIGVFARSSSFGYGINVEFAYTDNEVLPAFIYGKIGFEQFSGSSDFYQISDYTHFSTMMMPINVGARCYLPPIFEQIVLIIPALEVSASYALVNELNEFKSGSGKNNFSETKSKFGFSIGASISMFLLELTGNYNFFNGNQTVSIDLKTRLPLAISF